MCILPYTDPQWRSFFTAVGQPELMDRPEFATYSARVHTVEQLYGFVASVTPTRTTAEWVEILREKGRVIPCMPVIDIQALMDDEHLKAVAHVRAAPPSERGRHDPLVRPPVYAVRAAGRDPDARPGLRRGYSREVARELGLRRRQAIDVALIGLGGADRAVVSGARDPAGRRR